MNESTTLSIDLAKSVFQVSVFDQTGRVVRRKRLARNKLAAFVARSSADRVLMEACGSAHHWARTWQGLGKDVGLIAPQFVKPFRRGQKTDANDADAIGVAGLQPQTRFVGVKSVEQQSIQFLHRSRDRLMKQRIAISNQVRGMLAELGIVMARSDKAFKTRIPILLEDGDNPLPIRFRQLLADSFEEWQNHVTRIDKLTTELECAARDDVHSSRLMKQLPGIGPLSATALRYTVADYQAFANGRQFAAYLGLTPKQYSSGNKTVLLGISKGGQSDLRRLLIHGARAVIRHLGDKQDKLSCWLRALIERRGKNIAAIALANKNARQAWAIMARGASPCRPSIQVS